jgi:uncharacterized protein (DUF1800 family)
MSENSMSANVLTKEYIAVNRFGYGAKDDELVQAKAHPKQWIKSKLTPIIFSTSLPDSNDIQIAHYQYQQHQKQLRKQIDKEEKSLSSTNNMMKNFSRDAFHHMSVGTITDAIQSSNSVSWRLFDFFSNHFSVTANGRLMTGLVGTLEREAIAPHLFGNFEDMLLAVEQHPAMLIYLNNEKSYGPNSKVGKKRKLGLNENLAREIMELHSLGVNSEYSQADVIELAKALTGWSVKNYKKEQSTGFTFRYTGHEPGSRILLGKKYAQKGVEQGQQMLRDLAKHPATAKHICFKLAYHFVSEDPSLVLLKKMENTWLKTDGNIQQVMYSLFDTEEAWLSSPQKFKTPREFFISSYRAIASKNVNPKSILNSLASLGQQPFKAGSPAGYSDSASDWLGASALMARIDWSTMVSAHLREPNVEKIMADAIGYHLSLHTYQSVMRAESRQQAMTLFLMSPEFQRR